MSSEEHFLFQVDEGVGVVTLNRPKRMNAVSWDLASDLVSLFRDMRFRDDVRALADQVLDVRGLGQLQPQR